MTIAPEREEHVVLLDPWGRPAGTAPKRLVHTRHTPLHLGFSCYVFDRDGRVLVTRRSPAKLTWPDTWTNACCGHPGPAESLALAASRRLQEELGIRADRLAVAIADFTYRAVMSNGIVEHEVCPVLVAETGHEPSPDPTEVADAVWMPWPALRERARRDPSSLSPWSVAQIARLDALTPTPLDWLRRRDGERARMASPPWWPGCAATTGTADDAGTPATAGASEAAERHDVLAVLRRRLDEVLWSFLHRRAADLAGIDTALNAVAHEIAGLVGAGGKRLRPAFVYWGHVAGGGTNLEAAVHVGAAVEMLHTFALLHDDVMDDAATRRGRPAARHGFAARHALDAPGRDAAAFGTGAAILAGDLAFVWAGELLDGAPVSPGVASRLRRVFSALCTEVMAGQFLDLRLDGGASTDPEMARQVALLKSGRYTVTRPLQLGLEVADDAAPGVPDALHVFGDAVGLAFQLRDDILGLFGDPTRTGKPCGDDLRAGKRTLLVSRALALATRAERTVLEAALGDRHLDDAGTERCREIVARTGALASVETLLRAQLDTGLVALRAVPSPARSALHALATTAVERDT